MINLKLTDYAILNGKKFFYTHIGMNFQCAYCLCVQTRTFIRNKEGLIIGADVKPENEYHDDNCKQK